MISHDTGWMQRDVSKFQNVCLNVFDPYPFPFAESEKRRARRSRRFRPVAVKAGSSCTSATATSGKQSEVNSHGYHNMPAETIELYWNVLICIGPVPGVEMNVDLE